VRGCLILGDAILLPSAEHTKAKHRILSDYLNGWLSIIGQTSGRMIYLDGMAGSGNTTMAPLVPPFWLSTRLGENNGSMHVIALEVQLFILLAFLVPILT
jgi:hypothetical protein